MATTKGPTARGLRADAARNREAILDAALELYGRDAQASMAEVAAAAGVGRVTLYGHFATREELLEAALARALERAEARLAEVDLGGPAIEALDRVVRSSWEVVAGFHGLLVALERHVDADHLRAHHGEPIRRLEGLLERGRAEGSVRTDLPVAWLVTCITSVIHAAAAEQRAGRLAGQDPSEVVAATVRSIVARG